MNNHSVFYYILIRMAHFRPTEYEYTLSYFETLEFLATKSKYIFREMDMLKRKELIKEYVPFYITFCKEYSKFNVGTTIARAIRKKRYGNEYSYRCFPKIYSPKRADMTQEQFDELYRR